MIILPRDESAGTPATRDVNMSISRWKRFRKDEDGSVLVESILWLPFFLILTIAVLDICMIYLNLAFAQRVMQDGNRLLVTGKYKSCTETIDFIHARVQPGIPSANASCVIDGRHGHHRRDRTVRELRDRNLDRLCCGVRTGILSR